MAAQKLIFLLIFATTQVWGKTLNKRLDNGLALTPPMGWDTYNHYACLPNQSIVESNAKAIKDFGLADLGYYYVITDCGWTLPERTANGTMGWNASLFPGGFPEMGTYIHSLGLGFGVYSDAGIQQYVQGIFMQPLRS